MTPHQALEIFNPDNERQSLTIQRRAFAVLKSALKSISDSTDADGDTQPKNKERISGKINKFS